MSEEHTGGSQLSPGVHRTKMIGGAIVSMPEWQTETPPLPPTPGALKKHLKNGNTAEIRRELFRIGVHPHPSHPQSPPMRPAISYYPGYQPRAATLPERPSALHMFDLEPGMRIVSHSSTLDGTRTYTRHWVVQSAPYTHINSATGLGYSCIDAREVENHEMDKLPLDSVEGVDCIALSRWGAAIDSDGLYSQTSYIEPYIPAQESKIPHA